MSFLGTNWRSPSACQQGPTLTYNRNNENVAITVVNTGSLLHITRDNGKSWTELLPGKARTYGLKANRAGEIRLFDRPSLSGSNECTNLFWNPTY